MRHAHQSNNPQHSSRVCRAHQSTQSGYIMLPVMVTVVLVATIAFMMNHEGSMGARTVSNALQAEQARYVAEAGLQHALWQTEQQGCGPYTNLTNQALGSDSYTTNLTSGLGSTTSFPIAVDQDSWIDSDRPEDNHATDANLKILFDGGKIKRPIYRYDLSSLPADAAILSATAWFYVNNDHPEGAVDIHALTTDWNEADATWQTLGDSMDSAVLATIPTQPEKDVWVSVNLTAPVQAWINGLPNYGIALNSVIETVDGEYASREDSQQPYLTVIVGIAPSSPATLKSVGTLASGINRSITRDELRLMQKPDSFFSLQPDGMTGKDSFLKEDGASQNFGQSENLWLQHSEGSGVADRAILHFDLGAIPLQAKVGRATLELYASVNVSSPAGADLGVHRVSRDWLEGTENGGVGTGVTWLESEPGIAWTTSGGDFDPKPVDRILQPAGSSGWFQWDITTLVNAWTSGVYPNQGLVVSAETAGAHLAFSSSEHATPDQRPKLSHQL